MLYQLQNNTIVTHGNTLYVTKQVHLNRKFNVFVSTQEKSSKRTKTNKCLCMSPDSLDHSMK